MYSVALFIKQKNTEYQSKFCFVLFSIYICPKFLTMSIRNKYISASVTFVLCYLLCAFIGANVNPLEWSEWVRLFFIITLFIPTQLTKATANAE